MDIKSENLELTQEDLERILFPFVRSYRYYTGILPVKIVIPRVKELTFMTETVPMTHVRIPVELEADDAADRPQRAGVHSKASKPVSGNSNASAEPVKQE